MPLCNNNDIRDVFSSIVMKNMIEIHSATEKIKILNAQPEKRCELNTCNGYKINMKEGIEGEQLAIILNHLIDSVDINSIDDTHKEILGDKIKFNDEE